MCDICLPIAPQFSWQAKVFSDLHGWSMTFTFKNRLLPVAHHSGLWQIHCCGQCALHQSQSQTGCWDVTKVRLQGLGTTTNRTNINRILLLLGISTPHIPLTPTEVWLIQWMATGVQQIFHCCIHYEKSSHMVLDYPQQRFNPPHHIHRSNSPGRQIFVPSQGDDNPRLISSIPHTWLPLQWFMPPLYMYMISPMIHHLRNLGNGSSIRTL